MPPRDPPPPDPESSPPGCVSCLAEVAGGTLIAIGIVVAASGLVTVRTRSGRFDVAELGGIGFLLGSGLFLVLIGAGVCYLAWFFLRPSDDPASVAGVEGDPDEGPFDPTQSGRTG